MPASSFGVGGAACRSATQRLRDRGCADCQPEVVLRLLKTLADPNRGQGGRLRLATVARWRYSLKLSGGWEAVEEGARRREAVATLLLDRLLALSWAADGAGKAVVPFTLEELAEAVRGDIVLGADVADPVAEVQAALLMLHDWKVILLQEGRLLARHFPGRRTELTRPVSAETYARIVTGLGNPAQQAIVTAPVGLNLLVLAGPGSGKTRVIVHRCAYLMRVLRVPAQAILVLCFNHAAALSVRRLLRDLIGDEVGWVDAHTYHALAMRLVGASISERLERGTEATVRDPFAAVIRDATALLRGDSVFPGLDAEEVRERLLARYRYILIDEYQDIDEEQYDLVSAIAGRQEKDPEGRIALMAVGDDDQAVYGFRHADVAFIRRYREDYAAEVHHLVENYRSTAAVIAAANTLIRHNGDRMKTGHPIRIDRARAGGAAGEPVRVLAVEDAAHQIGTVMALIHERRALNPRASWSDVAVLARTRHDLAPFHALCERNGVPCDPAYDDTSDRFPLHRLREVVAFLDRLRRATARVDEAWLRAQLAAARHEQGASPWWGLVGQLLDGWAAVCAGRAAEPEAARDFLYEGLAQLRRERSTGAGIHIGTPHGAKGLEFRHVFILDGGWAGRPRAGTGAQEEERRLFYVGMTRARETLCLMRRADVRNPHLPLLDGVEQVASAAGRADPGLLNRQRTVLGLGDLYIDFAGRQPATAPVHRALAGLRPGDAVALRAPPTPEDRVTVLAADGTVVLRLSEMASRHWSVLVPAIEQARVHAVVRRYRTDGAEAWRGQLRTESWEVPIIEVWTHAAG
ncbi:superfamily I DNA/RNA helicase [Azospirillum agricola]|uniref:ATP-dependent helicase n=1 Tax=Azospirillum agricola TaxID=1720247 RepID=UPI001AE8A9A1|nr:ATP-dependent helicase [Azospirillum agricola]MBP2229385.1 superfamily I DNA/RNA helicase [Azospirillum agricola]